MPLIRTFYPIVSRVVRSVPVGFDRNMSLSNSIMCCQYVQLSGVARAGREMCLQRNAEIAF